MALLSINEIQEKMNDLNNWEMIGDGMTKQFQFDDFKKAMEFVNKIAEEAEKINHHPDMIISYNKVKITLTTHSAGGLTQKDFELAKIIDSI